MTSKVPRGMCGPSESGYSGVPWCTITAATKYKRQVDGCANRPQGEMSLERRKSGCTFPAHLLNEASIVLSNTVADPFCSPLTICSVLCTVWNDSNLRTGEV